MTDLLRPFRGPLTASPVEPVARFVPATVYAAAIVFASSIPGEQIAFQLDDRVAHFVEYFVLGLLLSFAAAGVRGGTGRLASVAILAFVAVFALADEYHQSFVPQRDPSIRDWVFDMLGTSAAVFGARRLAAPKEAV
ncbi:MAG: VanZ family protein [Thermoanaerobaculia bacterium]|nr:VanZ family protein [Thermoanaerobaculia bacterium]